jgi:hypothetical protein
MDASTRDLVDCATSDLHATFGTCADGALSLGVIGSWATGCATPVSDVDYYVIVDIDAVQESRSLPETGAVAFVDRAVRGALDTVRVLPQGDRLSVFWTTLQELEAGRYDVGRWPAYDRLCYRHAHRLFAGFPMDGHRVQEPTRADIILESARFALHTLRQQLDSRRFFARMPRLSGEDVADLGPIVLTKSTLMPVRILYTLLPPGSGPRVASTEEAVRSCREHYGSMPWWPLVEHAVAWRAIPPQPGDYPLAAQLMRQHALALYRFLLAALAHLVPKSCGRDPQLRPSMLRVAIELEGWRRELDSLGASSVVDPLEITEKLPATSGR